MTPTTDDLRALLERRADAPRDGLDDPATGARLAGVRDRIRRRRRARAAAAGLSLAVLAGGVTTGSLALRRPVPASAPATVPRVDGANRPLAATLQTQGAGAHAADARLGAGWADLHLVLRCTGSGDATAVVLASGRAVAALPCAGSDRDLVLRAPHDLVVTQAQARAWGLRPDQPLTVGLHLTRTATRARPLAIDEAAVLPDAHAVLDVYSPGALPTLPEVPPMPFHAVDPPGPRVLLATVTLPVTKDFATRSITVMAGGPVLEVEFACATPPGAVRFTLQVTADGRRLARGCDTGAWSDAGGDSGSFRDVRATGGRPITVTLRLAPAGQELPKGAALARDVPGALVGVTVRGTPYVAPVTPSR